MWLQYVAKVPRRERPSPQLMVGNAVHAALDKFYGLAVEKRSSELLHRCLRSVWAAHRKADTFATVEEERDYGHQALKLLDTFAERFDLGVKPLARERWVSTRLANGVELFGKVDRVDGAVRPDRRAGIELVDYKTGRFALESEELPDEPAAQAYLLAAEDEYGREVERLRFLYLATGAEARWEPEREDVEATRERLLALTWEMYTDTVFEPRPGEQCGRCPFAHACSDAGRVEVADLGVPDDILF